MRDELDKQLALPDPSAGLRLLADTGLLERFLPEATVALDDRLAALRALRPMWSTTTCFPRSCARATDSMKRSPRLTVSSTMAIVTTSG